MPQSAELAKLKEELKEELRAEVVRELLRSSVLVLRAQMTAELKAELSDQLYADVSERLAQRAEGSNFSLLCANSIDLEDRPSRAVPVADVQGQARKEIELVAELDRHLAARDASPPERQASSHPCGRLVDAGEVEDEVSIESSIWDCPLVIGTHAVRPVASVYVTLLLLVNVCVQLVFCAIVKEMAEPTITKNAVGGYRSWRRNVAHDISGYDSISGTSLAQRVCAKEQGIESSASQMVMYTVLDQYLGPVGNLTLGTLMCCLALFVWVLTVSKELTACVKTARAVRLAPHAPETVLTSDDGGKTSKFLSISPARKFLCLAVQLVRLGIDLWLLWYGIFYLVYTISVSDLLLNAVALEIVLGVDELIFEALLPARAETDGEPRRPAVAAQNNGARHGSGEAHHVGVRRRVAVLHRGAGAASGHGDSDEREGRIVRRRASLCVLVDGLGSLGWAYTEGGSSQKPERKWMSEENAASSLSADEYIVDIVLSGDRSRGSKVGEPFMLEECDFTLCYDDSEETLARRFGLMEPWDEHLRPPCCSAVQTKQMQVEAGTFSIKARQAQTTADATALWNPGCVDVLSLPGFYEKLNRNAFAAAIPDEACGGCPYDAPLCLPDGSCVDVTSCEMARPYCHMPSLAGLRARQLCPVTCGCDDLRARPWRSACRSVVVGISATRRDCVVPESLSMRRRVRISPSTIRNGRASQIRWRTQAQASPMDWASSASQARTVFATVWLRLDQHVVHGGDDRARDMAFLFPLRPQPFAMKGTRFGRSNRSRTFAQSRADADKATRDCPRTCPCADDSCARERDCASGSLRLVNY